MKARGVEIMPLVFLKKSNCCTELNILNYLTFAYKYDKILRYGNIIKCNLIGK